MPERAQLYEFRHRRDRQDFFCFSVAESIREGNKIKRRFSMFSISRHLPGFEHLFLRFHNIRWEAIVKNRLILILFLLPCFALNSLGSSPRYYLHLYFLPIYSTRNSQTQFFDISLSCYRAESRSLSALYYFFSMFSLIFHRKVSKLAAFHDGFSHNFTSTRVICTTSAVVLCEFVAWTRWKFTFHETFLREIVTSDSRKSHVCTQR